MNERFAIRITHANGGSPAVLVNGKSIEPAVFAPWLSKLYNDFVDISINGSPATTDEAKRLLSRYPAKQKSAGSSMKISIRRAGTPTPPVIPTRPTKPTIVPVRLPTPLPTPPTRLSDRQVSTLAKAISRAL